MNLNFFPFKHKHRSLHELFFWFGFVSLSLIMFSQVARYNFKLNNYLASQTNLQNQLEQINQEIFQVQPEPLLPNSSSSQTTLTQLEIVSLQRRGLSNPIQDLKNDLLTRTDLIPFEPVLGGTYQFLGTENITILNSKWVFAIVEDGHQQGQLLLSYEVSDVGTIKWQVIDLLQL